MSVYMSAQTDKLLRHLAQLSIALEDCQTLGEAEMHALAVGSAEEALRHVREMQRALHAIEAGLPVDSPVRAAA